MKRDIRQKQTEIKVNKRYIVRIGTSFSSIGELTDAEKLSICARSFESMRLKFYKQSAEKFVSRIDPEAFSASGSRVIFPVACHLRFKASATKRGEEFH